MTTALAGIVVLQIIRKPAPQERWKQTGIGIRCDGRVARMACRNVEDVGFVPDLVDRNCRMGRLCPGNDALTGVPRGPDVRDTVQERAVLRVTSMGAKRASGVRERRRRCRCARTISPVSAAQSRHLGGYQYVFTFPAA
jgi:hypothetical protein